MKLSKYLTICYLKERITALITFCPNSSLQLHISFYIFFICTGTAVYDVGFENGRNVYKYNKYGKYNIPVTICK